MSRGRARAWLAVALLTTACGTPPAPPLVPVPLPDLGRADETVRDRIESRHAEVVALVERGAPPGELASGFGGLGSLLFAAGYPEAARPAYLNAQALDPDAFRWPYFLAQIDRRRGATQDAMAHFTRALEIRPGEVAALYWLGDLYLAVGRTDDADAAFGRAQAGAPDSAAVYYGRGRVALARRDYRTAATLLESALELDPAASAARYSLGLAYRGLGDLEAANRQLGARGERAPVPADPWMAELGTLLDGPSMFRVRGLQAVAARRWAEAVRQFRLAVEAAPEDPLLHLNLGSALSRLGDASGAVREYEATLRLDPGSVKAHYALGLVLEQTGHDEEAMGHYEAAIDQDAAFGAARQRLADALRRHRRFAEALAEYERVLELDPGQPEATLGRGMSLVGLSRDQEAREVFATAMVVHPDQPAFAHALARLLAASPDDRVRDGRRALDLVGLVAARQRSRDLEETAAMAYAEVGDYAQAIRWQRAAIDAALRAGRIDLAAEMSESLASYQRGEPLRQPWRADDPVHFPGPAGAPAREATLFDGQ